MPHTLASIVAAARTLLQDKNSTATPGVRYTNEEMAEALNDGLREMRAKRPDAFLGSTIGIRGVLPSWTADDITNATPVDWPLDDSFAPAMIYYLVGRADLREDPFAADGRAVAMMNKFVSQLVKVES